jgi:hypothetical protein
VFWLIDITCPAQSAHPLGAKLGGQIRMVLRNWSIGCGGFFYPIRFEVNVYQNHNCHESAKFATYFLNQVSVNVGNTTRLLDILKQRNIKVTFFMIGPNVVAVLNNLVL